MVVYQSQRIIACWKERKARVFHCVTAQKINSASKNSLLFHSYLSAPISHTSTNTLSPNHKAFIHTHYSKYTTLKLLQTLPTPHLSSYKQQHYTNPLTPTPTPPPPPPPPQMARCCRAASLCNHRPSPAPAVFVRPQWLSDVVAARRPERMGCLRGTPPWRCYGWGSAGIASLRGPMDGARACRPCACIRHWLPAVSVSC